MAEKIKVSVIIDNEAVKKLAFALAKTPEEYREVEKIIYGNDEVVRDNTNESDEKVKNACNSLFSKIAIDTIIRNNKDLIMSKNVEDAAQEVDKLITRAKNIIKKISGGKGDDDTPDNEGGTMKCVKLTKEQAKEFMDRFGSMFGED